MKLYKTEISISRLNKQDVNFCFAVLFISISLNIFASFFLCLFVYFEKELQFHTQMDNSNMLDMRVKYTYMYISVY